MFYRGRHEGHGGKFRGQRVNEFCVCPKCNYSMAHLHGNPCQGVYCPQCHIPLIKGVPKNEMSAPEMTKKNIKVCPTINLDLCIGCGDCIGVCTRDAIVLQNGKPRILEEKCRNCMGCITVCPVGAIS